MWKPQTIEMYMKLQLLELSDSDYKITMFTVFKEIQRDKNYKKKHCILAKSKINFENWKLKSSKLV